MLSRGVDTLGNALRQYAAVPADTTTTSTASVLAVDIRQFPWIRRLASDYAYDYARVEPFFAGDPATPAAWADTIRRSQSTPRRPAELAAVLANQQARRGAPAEARAAAARLADPATRVVITGQQAGLFGGPLFTLLKALTAMKLAAAGRARARRAGRAGVLDRRRGPRLGGSVRVYGARCRARPARRAPGRSRRAPGNGPSPGSPSRTRSPPPSTTSRPRCPTPSSAPR